MMYWRLFACTSALRSMSVLCRDYMDAKDWWPCSIKSSFDLQQTMTLDDSTYMYKFHTAL